MIYVEVKEGEYTGWQCHASAILACSVEITIAHNDRLQGKDHEKN